MSSSNEKKSFIITHLAMLFCVVLFLCLDFFSFFDRFSFCFFGKFFHLYCPVCGCTRAMWSLLRLDILGALRANPTTLYLCLTALYYDFFWFWRVFIQKDNSKILKASKIPSRFIPVVVLLFCLLRNIVLVFWGVDPLGDMVAFWHP